MENRATFRVKHHDHYSDAGKFSDPADWDVAYVGPNQIDEIEPLPEVQSDYRTAAKTHTCMATLKRSTSTCRTQRVRGWHG
jgi:hypothetical protein